MAPLGCQWGVLSQISCSTSSCNSCKAERRCLPGTQQHTQRDRLCTEGGHVWGRQHFCLYSIRYFCPREGRNLYPIFHLLTPPALHIYMHPHTHTHTHTHTQAHTPYLGGVLEEFLQNTVNIADLRLLPLARSTC